MAFKDIVVEWEKLEASRYKAEEQSLLLEGNNTNSEEEERRMRRQQPFGESGNEYVFTPLEFRKLELEQRLLRRPSIFQLIQKDIIPQEMTTPDGWGHHNGEGGGIGGGGGGEDYSFHSLLGYDLMKPSLMAKQRSAISIGGLS